MKFFIVGAAYFVYVFFRSFQQRNVAFLHYNWIMPVSLCMALIDVFVISSVAKYGFDLWLVLCIGVGGGLGCIVAMQVHTRYLKWPTNHQSTLPQ